MTGERLRLGRYTIELSNQGKVLFPDDGITKGDLVEYYARIAERMVPLVRERPLSLERFPDGIDGQRVFQQKTPAYFPAWIRRVEVRKEGGRLDHVVCENAATLAYLANQAVITPHAWLSRADRQEHPDRRQHQAAIGRNIVLSLGGGDIFGEQFRQGFEAIGLGIELVAERDRLTCTV